MTKLPVVTAVRLLRALTRAGFVEVHRRGSHVMLVHSADHARVAVVPVHKGTTLKRGTLRGILRSTGLTIEDLLELL